MKINVEKILNHIGYTEEEFINEISLSMNEWCQYKEGKVKLPREILGRIMEYTGLLPKDFQYEDGSTLSQSNLISPQYTWEPSELAKSSIVDYVKQGLEDIKDGTVQYEIRKLEHCVKSLKKPKISFAGQSDTGKSTLINALLGAEKMPAKWTPTTSIVVHIKHIDDRPNFIDDDVWIFGKQENQYWDDSKLDDEIYCKRFVIAKGDYPVLETYGTHQHETEIKKEAFSAVAFIDSPLLKNCDILDIPGFGATKEDDALHKFNTQENETDILIYLSRSNGFLQESDLDYLLTCMDSLKPVEQNGRNSLGKLDNLFIVASQAQAVNGGNYSELQNILDSRCEALCKLLVGSANSKTTLLSTRSELTGYKYLKEDLRARFYTFEKELPRLCKKFLEDFTILIEKLPDILYSEFCEDVESIASNSSEILVNRIREYQSMVEDREPFLEIVHAIKEQEPIRKIKQQEQNKSMLTFTDKLQTFSKQEIQTFFNAQMTEENLVELIEKYGYKNKKADKKEFSTLVHRILTEGIQDRMKAQTEDFTKKVEIHLSEYDKSFRKYQSSTGKRTNFDSFNFFNQGIGDINTLGALAVWAAASFVFSNGARLGLMGFGRIIAIGNLPWLTISIAAAAIFKVIQAFTWKKSLAKEIIKIYKDKNYILEVLAEIDLYWNDTKETLKTGFEKIEEEWKKKIEDYEMLADEDELPRLKSELFAAHRGLEFFSKIPSNKQGELGMKFKVENQRNFKEASSRDKSVICQMQT